VPERRGPREPDPLGDLDPADRRPAAERLAELDAVPEPGARKPAAPRPSSRYAWVLGVAFILVVIVAGANLLREGDGAALRGPTAGQPSPVFAAPLASGTSGADTNVRQTARQEGETGGATPACEVRGEGILNLCDLRSRPVVLTFIVTRGADCEPQLDVVERVSADFPGVSFVGVVSGIKREEVAELARKRGWTFPVAVDPDGALFNVFRLGICPSTVLLEPGGTVRETRLGALAEADLRAAVEALPTQP